MSPKCYQNLSVLKECCLVHIDFLVLLHEKFSIKVPKKEKIKDKIVKKCDFMLTLCCFNFYLHYYF